MKVAVTGASGYVGGVIRSGFQQQGHDVLSLSRRPCPGPWLHYDLADDPSGLPWDDVDLLVHAAYDFGPVTWEDVMKKNVNTGIALLREAGRRGVRRMIFVSSISAFEGTRSNYGKAKLLLENEALGLGAVVIRPGLVWGGQPGGVMGALNGLVEKLPVIPCLQGRGGLGQFLVHEDDLSRAVVAIAENLPAGGGTIHEAANPLPVPLLEILRTISARMGRVRRYIPVPWQFAMFGLKIAEGLGLRPPFRSDSLTGLVHRTPVLRFGQPPQGVTYRPFLP